MAHPAAPHGFRDSMATHSQAPAAAKDAQPEAATVTVTVAADGSADFRTVQSAVDQVPADSTHRTVIHIKPGTYNERVNIPASKSLITLKGDNAESTVISADANAARDGGTFNTGTVSVYARGFIADTLTIENSFGPGSQAVALILDADQAVVRHVRLIGYQDTLFANGGRQFYEDDYIEGAVDFIFGNAAAVFEHSSIHSVARGYLTAQSRTSPDQTSGFVFRDCKVTGSGPATTLLGRPWRPYSRVVFLHCDLDSSVRPEGWDNWKTPAAESTAYFGEFDSQGPGAAHTGRVAWAHRLTAADIAQFEAVKFLGWDPHTPVN